MPLSKKGRVEAGEGAEGRSWTFQRELTARQVSKQAQDRGRKKEGERSREREKDHVRIIGRDGRERERKKEMCHRGPDGM